MLKYIFVLILTFFIIIAGGLIVKHKIRKRLNNFITARLSTHVIQGTIEKIVMAARNLLKTT